MAELDQGSANLDGLRAVLETVSDIVVMATDDGERRPVLLLARRYVSDPPGGAGANDPDAALASGRPMDATAFWDYVARRAPARQPSAFGTTEPP